MKVANFPENWRDNPFLDLLENHLEALGVGFRKVGSDYLQVRWIWQHRRDVDVLHFHWLQYHYSRKNTLSSLIALLKFFLKIVFAKICGYRIVWTMHNLLPHERRIGIMDRVCYSFFTVLASSIVTLCRKASLELEKTYHRRRNVFSGYLGHYAGIYPNEVSQNEARERLGLGQCDMVFLFFGSIRPYKGIENLIGSFKTLSDSNFRLVIAGKANEESFQRKILTMASSDPRIQVFLDWIPDSDVQLYFNACDYVVLPFTDVLTSSSAMLGLCFKRAIVAPAIGCLPEIILPGAGILYDPSIDNGLQEALEKCKKSESHQMGEEAWTVSQHFRWEDLAVVTLKAYQVGNN